jgi:hypothetical protein
MTTTPQTRRARGLRSPLLAVVLVLVSLAAACLSVHQWMGDGGVFGFGGDVQHRDPGSISAPEPLQVTSLSPEAARAAGDPGSQGAVRGPETCGDMRMRARVCSPSIGIDAALEQVAADSAGNMAVPTHQNQAAIGWYSASAPIGAERGNSVLAGHVDYPYSAPALATLYTAKPGQKLWVSDGSGAVFSYTVTAVRAPTPRTDPPMDIFKLSGTPGLSLVTCSGAYIQSGGSSSWSYTNNLIVDFALDPETAHVA